MGDCHDHDDDGYKVCMFLRTTYTKVHASILTFDPSNIEDIHCLQFYTLYFILMQSNFVVCLCYYQNVFKAGKLNELIARNTSPLILV